MHLLPAPPTKYDPDTVVHIVHKSHITGHSITLKAQTREKNKLLGCETPHATPLLLHIIL